MCYVGLGTDTVPLHTWCTLLEEVQARIQFTHIGKLFWVHVHNIDGSAAK